MARTPEIDVWKILPSGAVNGVSKFHPTIGDGGIITTSPLADPTAAAANAVVKTKSGSRYKLLQPAAGQKVRLAANLAKKQPVVALGGGGKKKAIAKKPAITTKEPPQAKQASNSGGGGGGFFSVFGGGGASKANGQAQSKPSPKTIPPPTAATSNKPLKKSPPRQPAKPKPKPKPTPKPKPQKTTTTLPLSGKSVGNGKYLLAGKPEKSTSGKSQIWRAYRSDKSGNPTGDLLAVKLSANYGALLAENENYNKVAGGLKGLNAGSIFVQKMEFLEDADGGVGFETFSALVLENGCMDLKEFLQTKARNGLKGRAMRDAAAAAGRAIEAMHGSSLVWTDLKTENFVILTDADGRNGLPGVKAIDLESARPFRSQPTDYSPEACPPEFASAFLAGNGAEFIVEPSYDMWSLGMMLYELSTGEAYFGRASPSTITTKLRSEDFVVDVSGIEDPKLRNLVAKCLARDPKKRPNIVEFLLHPYFTTSGVGPFSF